MRAQTQLGMNDQYGQNKSYDKINPVSQSQNFVYKKASLPAGNSRRRQAGQSVGNSITIPNSNSNGQPLSSKLGLKQNLITNANYQEIKNQQMPDLVRPQSKTSNKI